jgi:hypothetical protein
MNNILFDDNLIWCIYQFLDIKDILKNIFVSVYYFKLLSDSELYKKTKSIIESEKEFSKNIKKNMPIKSIAYTRRLNKKLQMFMEKFTIKMINDISPLYLYSHLDKKNKYDISSIKKSFQANFDSKNVNDFCIDRFVNILNKICNKLILEDERAMLDFINYFSKLNSYKKTYISWDIHLDHMKNQIFQTFKIRTWDFKNETDIYINNKYKKITGTIRKKKRENLCSLMV